MIALSLLVCAYSLGPHSGVNDPTVDPSELELIWGHVRMEMALLSAGHGSLGESQHSLSSLFHRMIDTEHGYGLDAVTGP